MDYRQISIQLLEKLGGKENISSNAACMTRLRVGIRDMSRVDLAGVKKVEGVLGVVESNTLQIVFGPGKVNKVLEEFYQLTGLAKGVAEDPDAAPAKTENVSDLTRENKEKQKAKHDKPVQRFLKKIANIFVALLPGIIAAGLINGICNVINVSTDGALSGLWWYECIRTMGWALFAYLPILVGFNAAREFGGSGVLGAIAGTMSIANTAMPLLATFDDKQITLPFTNAVFNPGGGRTPGRAYRRRFLRFPGKTDTQDHAGYHRYLYQPAASADNRRPCGPSHHPACGRHADERDFHGTYLRI